MINSDLLQLLKNFINSGLQTIWLGIESFSSGLLEELESLSATTTEDDETNNYGNNNDNKQNNKSNNNSNNNSIFGNEKEGIDWVDSTLLTIGFSIRIKNIGLLVGASSWTISTGTGKPLLEFCWNITWGIKVN